MKYFLGIDVGTSGVKALLISDKGETAGLAQREYEIIKPLSSYAEQKMDEIWAAAASAIKEVVNGNPDKKKDIRGIGFSGQMHGLVMLDKNGKEVRNSIIWADQRSEDAIENIYRKIGKDEYRKITLNSLSTGFLISSLIWVREHEPGNFEKIAKIMLPKDYIRYRICSEIGTDMSDASGSGIFDTSRRQWAFPLIDRLELDRALFPDCHESASIAGQVSKSCSEQTDLPEGIAVVYGGGDTPIQAVGNGIKEAGMAISNIGTASQFLTISQTCFYDDRFRTNTFCHVEAGKWLVMGANLSGGVALKWLKNNILSMNSYDEMTLLASRSRPGSNKVFFLPYLNGERTPWNDPKARGVFLGLGLKNNRADMIRAAMEGIVFAQRSSMEILQEMGIKIERIIASGGGAKSSLFRQMIADQLGYEVMTGEVTEQACVGAAISAAVGTGEYNSFYEACSRMIKFNDELTCPILENRKIYDECFEVYKEIYTCNKGLFEKINMLGFAE